VPICIIAYLHHAYFHHAYLCCTYLHAVYLCTPCVFAPCLFGPCPFAICLCRPCLCGPCLFGPCPFAPLFFASSSSTGLTGSNGSIILTAIQRVRRYLLEWYNFWKPRPQAVDGTEVTKLGRCSTRARAGKHQIKNMHFVISDLVYNPSKLT